MFTRFHLLNKNSKIVIEFLVDIKQSISLLEILLTYLSVNIIENSLSAGNNCYHFNDFQLIKYLIKNFYNAATDTLFLLKANTVSKNVS